MLPRVIATSIMNGNVVRAEREVNLIAGEYSSAPYPFTFVLNADTGHVAPIGTNKTPQLLAASGIANATLLKSLGIDTL